MLKYLRHKRSRHFVCNDHVTRRKARAICPVCDSQLQVPARYDIPCGACGIYVHWDCSVPAPAWSVRCYDCLDEAEDYGL